VRRGDEHRVDVHAGELGDAQAAFVNADGDYLQSGAKRYLVLLGMARVLDRDSLRLGGDEHAADEPQPLRVAVRHHHPGGTRQHAAHPR
jgi:hypothetical protein